MSIADFDNTLQTHIFKNIAKRNMSDRKAYIESLETGKLRTKYESAAMGSSSIMTEASLEKLKNSLLENAKELSIAGAAEAVLKSINFSEFSSYVRTNFSSAGGMLEEGGGTLRLNNVPQTKLKELFAEYLAKSIANLSSEQEAAVYDYIISNIQNGHLAGVFSLKLKQALNLEISEVGNTYRDFTITNDVDSVTKNTLEMVLKAILDADFVTSNINDNESLIMNAVKSVLGNNPHLEIELQFGKDNEAAGRRLSTAGSYLNKLIDAISGKAEKQLGQSTSRSGAVNNFTKLIKSLKPLADDLVARGNYLVKSGSVNAELYRDIISNATNLQKLADHLLSTKGSPSLIESAALNYANVLVNGKVLPEVKTRVSKKQKVSSDPAAKDLSKLLKKASSALKQVTSKIQPKTIKQIPKKNLAVSNLTSLETLINRHLQDAVSSNMGDGNRKDILNYRTGRFASTVKLEKLTQSSSGAISAFYSYMKNPYATFSDGGAQQFPKSRDPKTLIAKSIREIAQERAVTIFRAINV